MADRRKFSVKDGLLLACVGLTLILGAPTDLACVTTLIQKYFG